MELKFGPEHYYKTQVFKKSLNPKWNAEFRMEVYDAEYIQDNVMQFIVWDYDLVISKLL